MTKIVLSLITEMTEILHVHVNGTHFSVIDRNIYHLLECVLS